MNSILHENEISIYWNGKTEFSSEKNRTLRWNLNLDAFPCKLFRWSAFGANHVIAQMNVCFVANFRLDVVTH